MVTGWCRLTRRLADMEVYDAIIVGGGPAGLAAAIQFATKGHSVAVIERSSATPDGPGETLHPGIEPIFERLGVKEAMQAQATMRHDAIVVDRGSSAETVPYGQGWSGFQLRRRALNRALQRRLKNLDGHYCPGVRVLERGESFDGHLLETMRGSMKGRWLLDGSGMSGWLNRRLGASLHAVSMPIYLRYGYRAAKEGDGDVPRLSLRDKSWSWRAPIGDGETAWVECTRGRPFFERKPGSLGADGTWRLSRTPAGSSYFRIGDAACRLDPSNGHGVLRAMMSGMMAAHLATCVDDGAVRADEAAGIYCDWIRHWFGADARHLRNLMADLGPMAISKSF